MKILPLVVVGILLGEWLGAEAWRCAIGAAIALGCALAFGANSRVATIYAMAGVVLTAMTTTALRQTPNNLPYDQTITTKAIITSATTERGRWNECEARIKYNDESYKIFLRTDTALLAPQMGDEGSLRAKVRRLPEVGYGRLMSRRGFAATLYSWSEGDWEPTHHTVTPQIWARRCQQRLVERVDRLSLTANQASVVKAMALGWRSDIDPALRSAYARTGCAHLLAISGLHVGIVAMLVWAMLWFLPLTSRRGHIWRNLLSMIAMVGYAVVTGMSPSVMRATLMFCTAQFGWAMGSKRSAEGALCVALSLMLLFNPNNLFDTSFQLSAIAVVGIMAGFEPLMDKVRCNIGIVNALWGTVLIGVCSMIATLPIVAHTFGIVGFVGIVLNPLVILTANAIVLGTMVWVILPIEALAPVVGRVVGFCAQVQNSCVEAAAAHDWLVVETTPPSWVAIICYALMFVLLAVAHYHKDKPVWKIKK